jgi:hypothetical protein
MRYTVLVRFQIVHEPRDVSREELEAQFERVYGALLWRWTSRTLT